MEEERLRQIILEETSKALEQVSLTTNYHMNVSTKAGPQPLLWPLMALVHKWRIIATRIDMAIENEANPAKSAQSRVYKETAKDLEDWIKSGALELDS